MCWGELFNLLPMNNQCAQKGTLWTNALYRTCVFRTYIVWFQLTHLHIPWRHSWHIFSNVRSLKVMAKILYWWQAVSWHDCANIRIFPDGEVFTCMILWINTVRYYWWKICIDGQFIMSVNFITLNYLK